MMRHLLVRKIKNVPTRKCMQGRQILFNAVPPGLKKFQSLSSTLSVYNVTIRSGSKYVIHKCAMSSFHQPLALYAGNTFITANSSLPEIYIFYST